VAVLRECTERDNFVPFFFCPTHMKKLLLLAALLTAGTGVRAQQSVDLADGEPELINGIEYGFTIRNERTKEVRDEAYSRYEVTVYVTNRSGCTRLMFPRQTTFGLENQNLLAEFDCLNATGKRMTSKSSTLRAKPFTVPYSTQVKNAEGKMVTNTIQVPAGHALRNGETVSENFIVIVPMGEKPRMKARVRELVDAF
jgi:hypothetical protein